MQILNTTNLNELRKQVQKLKKSNSSEKIAILSQDDDFNRKALEIKGINLFIINESLQIKDYMKQRASGLNEVLAKLAKSRNIQIAIEIDKIITKGSKEKARALARLIQNIMLCKKAGTKLSFISENKELDKKDLQALFLSLGATTRQAQEALKEGF